MKPYIPRNLETVIREAVRQFPVIGLTGPRQTGKSTLLQHLFPGYEYFTFDDPVLRASAIDDPGMFINNISGETIIDEIQYVPELLPYIKIAVDRNRADSGQFLLTGSQPFSLMEGLSESLSGRIALFELLGFSAEEVPVLSGTPVSDNLFQKLLIGFYPDPAVHGVSPQFFYPSYVQTYLERDIRQVRSVHDLSLFQNFLELLAARSGSLLNLSEVARDCGISHATAQQWLSLLESTRIIYLLRPYYKNITKRTVKSPKIYFTDTGLLSYILRYSDSKTLMTGPMAGNIFETFVINEIVKFRFNYAKNFELYFYRDSNGNEIDCVIDTGLHLILLEIKMRTTIKEKHVSSLSKFPLDTPGLSRFIVSFWEHNTTVLSDVVNIPWWNLSEFLHEQIP